jgi:hypothetical protein
MPGRAFFVAGDTDFSHGITFNLSDAIAGKPAPTGWSEPERPDVTQTCRSRLAGDGDLKNAITGQPCASDHSTR